ncbi:MAG: MBL fold metallo-hydrolase [Myxococcales bacterium]|nr:MBL fold metallo-hydrolase [Myxococcales bacterium]
MLIRQMFDSDSSTYTYLVADQRSKQAALIDPVAGQVERDLALVRELGLTLVHVLETHIHADHITGAGALRERTGATTVASSHGAACIDRHVAHGEVIRLGDVAITALTTPGHTDDGVSYVTTGAVFTGDTLLIRGCGRSDFQNGNPEALYHSITQVLFALPDDTVVYPGHDYKGLTTSTIGEEKRHNPRVAGKSRDQFVEIMNNLKLPPPKHLLEAVPANRACGTVPVQEAQ